jgi:RNA polymerase sigma-70 factor (ECF subfamily)
VFSDELVDQLAARQQSDERLADLRRVALDGCLRKLRPADRDLVDRCYRDEQSFKQVADRMGKPLGSVYHALSRIRRSLFDCIELTVSREEAR